MTRVFWIVLLVLIDQVTKVFARLLSEQIQIIPSVLSFHFVKNTGAAFGIFPGLNILFVILSVLALWLLIMYRHLFSTPLEKKAWALIIAGVFGNLLDRLFFGYVTDFITFPFWPSFNIADSCISIGVGMLFFSAFFQKKKRKLYIRK